MKKSNIIKVLIVTGVLIFTSHCSNITGNGSGSDESGNQWLISENQVVDGGPGKDGIPAIEEPEMIPATEIDYLDDSDLISGVRIGDIVVGYPHKILDYHEIINHTIDNSKIILSYCPLTGSALAWSSVESGDFTFGVSGLLYNSNLILYDRMTDSNWSQMSILCVNGKRIGEVPEVYPVFETTWKTWKKINPDSLVMSLNTGYQRNYNEYPYGDFKTSDNLIFSINNSDTRLHLKERVHGISSGDSSVAYPISSFGENLTILNHEINEEKIVVAISTGMNFAISFKRVLDDGTELEFTAINGKLPVIMKDQSGNEWDLFGRSVSGPLKGEELGKLTSHNAYWFAWAAFHPDTEIISVK